jgi:hypothetical protein
VDEADLAAGFAHLDQERQFWHGHRAEYLSRFPDEWIAVKADGSVLAHSSDLFEFAGLITRCDRRAIYQTFLEKTPVRYIL